MKKLIGPFSVLVILTILLTSCSGSPSAYVIQSRTIGGLTEEAFAPKAIPPQQVKLSDVSAGRTWTSTVVGEGTCTMYKYANGLATESIPLTNETQFTEFSESESISCDTPGTYVRFDTRYDETAPTNLVIEVTPTPPSE